MGKRRKKRKRKPIQNQITVDLIRPSVLVSNIQYGHAFSERDGRIILTLSTGRTTFELHYLKNRDIKDSRDNKTYSRDYIRKELHRMMNDAGIKLHNAAIIRLEMIT